MDAESLAANAVHLYTCEDEWQMCQERGFELLEALYSKADRLKIVQVLICMDDVPCVISALAHLDLLFE